MSRVSGIVFVFTFVALGAAGPGRAERPESPVGQPPATETRHLVGTLRHTPMPAGKTVEAYLGIEFVLEATGEKVVLSASKAVRPEALVALKNRVVEVTCIPRAPVVPSRDESYPMEPDGTPMKRPPTCEVVTVRGMP